MNYHELKTDPDVFEMVFDGSKLFEIRKNDRNFQKGDQLRLRETVRYGFEMAQQHLPAEYTGREVVARVIGIMKGPRYGLAEGWCIMSIQMLHRTANGRVDWKSNP